MRRMARRLELPVKAIRQMRVRVSVVRLRIEIFPRSNTQRKHHDLAIPASIPLPTNILGAQCTVPVPRDCNKLTLWCVRCYNVECQGEVSDELGRHLVRAIEYVTVTCHNFQTCPVTKSLSMFYEIFWNMSIKQASQPCVGSTKSVALARRTSFIAIYMLRRPKSNRRLPSRPTLPKEFTRLIRVTITQI